ncbi:MMPL family transporter [Planctomicrobium sp. SH661]|uniref:MMPL family transporter n=1 Tax=Planctomicrobium sp. SH661 TaxID=3448124 RepID=UPI003F5BE972
MDRTTDTAKDEGPLTGLILWLTRAVISRPGVTLTFSIALAVISLGITVRFLTFKTDRSDLIDSNAEFHQRWLRFEELFGDDSDVVVVVEGDAEADVKQAMDRIGKRLEAEPDYFSRVLYKVDPSSLQTRALQYLTPADLEKANARLEMYGPILAGHWSRAGLESYCRRLANYIKDTSDRGAGPELAGAISQSEALISSLAGFLQNPQNFTSPWPEVVSQSAFPQAGNLEPRYQLTPSGKMGFVLALPRVGADNFSGNSKSLKKLDQILAESRLEFPRVRLGATGIPVLEAEEMARSQYDMTASSLISTIGVALIMLAGFRGFRHPIISMLMLAVGFAWTMGFITLSVGHLNILSVSFAAILIGLGVDYSIHYLTHYVELRRAGHSLEDSLITTVKEVGTGSVTAAISTSLSFFSATFTNFLGVSELGIIAGGGILLCALATLTVLPAMIVVSDKNLKTKQVPSPFEGVLLRKVINRCPRLVTCLALLLVFGVGLQAFEWKDGWITSKVKYDYNLLNLQAQGLEAVDLQERIFDESNGSLLFAVSIADSPENARLLKEKFLELPTVSRVEDLASYLPAYPASETGLLVQAIHARLSGLSELPREYPQLNPLTLGQGLESLYQTLKTRTEPAAQTAAATLNSVLNMIEQLSLEQQMQVFGGYQQGLLMSLHRQFQMLASISDPRPISPQDFPEALRSRFVSRTGEWLVRVYPSSQIWDEVPLRNFVEDVRKVDPEATGTPLQNFEAAGQMQESYMVASLYALAAILLVLLMDGLQLGPMLVSLISPLIAVGLWFMLARNSGVELKPVWLLGLYVAVSFTVAGIFDLSSVRNTFVAMLPPALGLLLVFGIMAIAGIELNPANLIVLPLIMGIGVDEGVLVIHDYRSQKGRYSVGASTINSVTLTSVTSIIGFGSMMIASHRGLVSLSVVLTLGVVTCLFISLVMLPAMLTWLSLSRRSKEETPSDQQDQDEEALVVPMIATHPISSAA